MKRRIVTDLPLPILNWTPLTNVDNTVFKQIDDELVLARLNQPEFEKAFQRKTNNTTEALKGAEDVEQGTPKNATKTKPTEVNVVDPNRSRNTVIAKRRVGLKVDDLKEGLKKDNLR